MCSEDRLKNKKLVITSIVFNLSLLFSFKYLSFSWNTLVHPLGETLGMTLPILEKSLPPVGISFFTFQTMSYAMDVYRGNLNASKSFLNFAVYVSMFPQLVAGPIVRAKDLLPQIAEKAGMKWNMIGEGGQLFLRGFIKKVCIADTFAVMIVDAGFRQPELFSPEWRVLIMLAYSFQIYFDFSGYSDMAIGIGKVMGFEFPKNFDHPYRSASFSEFWTRWHISLSSWLKDYLYIPLGGNKKSTLRTYFNLMLTMTLGGLWHGASWMFVLWGVLHGLALILQRLASSLFKGVRVPKLFSVVLVFSLTTLFWVPFRSDNLDHVLMFWMSPFEISLEGVWSEISRLNWNLKLLFSIAVGSHFLLAFCPANFHLKWLPFPIKVVLWSTLLFWMLHFYPEGQNVQPFIYFQF